MGLGFGCLFVVVGSIGFLGGREYLGDWIVGFVCGGEVVGVRGGKDEVGVGFLSGLVLDLCMCVFCFLVVCVCWFLVFWELLGVRILLFFWCFFLVVLWNYWICVLEV